MPNEYSIDPTHEVRAGLFANRELQRKAVEREDGSALDQLLTHEHRLLWLLLMPRRESEAK